MKFTPQSEEKLAENAGGFDLWPPGEYDFEVSSAEETQSKAGNDMVKLTLYVFNDAGRRRTVFDYLVSTEKAMFKIAQFAKSAGMWAEYERGEMYAEDMAGKSGRLKLGVRKSTSLEYSDQNAVTAYLEARGRPASAVRSGLGVQKPTRGGGDLDDEIPF